MTINISNYYIYVIIRTYPNYTSIVTWSRCCW
jgi:hypothetical protein